MNEMIFESDLKRMDEIMENNAKREELRAYFEYDFSSDH